MTSHELSEVAVSADTLVFLSHGKVLASGTQASLAKRFDARASFRAAPRLDVVSLSQTVGTDVHEVAPGQYRLGESFDRSALGRLDTALVDLGTTMESFSGGGSLEDLYYDLYRTEPPHEAPPERRRRRGAR
jgi:ABC-type multidrug transport system ATPase subunit